MQTECTDEESHEQTTFRYLAGNIGGFRWFQAGRSVAGRVLLKQSGWYTQGTSGIRNKQTKNVSHDTLLLSVVVGLGYSGVCVCVGGGGGAGGFGVKVRAGLACVRERKDHY